MLRILHCLENWLILWCVCQPQALASLYFPDTCFISVPGTHFCYRLVKPQGQVRLKVLGKLTTFNYLVGSRTGDLVVCSLMLQALGNRVPTVVFVIFLSLFELRIPICFFLHGSQSGFLTLALLQNEFTFVTLE
jgi:hypothetical protein